MVEARWNGEVIARSDETIVVEGNHYFAPDAVYAARLKPSGTTTVCPWKGTAHYFTVVVDGGECRRRLVLSRAEARRGRDQGPDRLLERRRGRLTRRSVVTYPN